MLLATIKKAYGIICSAFDYWCNQLLAVFMSKRHTTHIVLLYPNYPITHIIWFRSLQYLTTICLYLQSTYNTIPKLHLLFLFVSMYIFHNYKQYTFIFIVSAVIVIANFNLYLICFPVVSIFLLVHYFVIQIILV